MAGRPFGTWVQPGVGSEVLVTGLGCPARVPFLSHLLFFNSWNHEDGGGCLSVVGSRHSGSVRRRVLS